MTKELTKHQKQIARMLRLMDERTKDLNHGHEHALFHLLTQWKDQLPELDAYFHKAFRQVDVTSDGHTDMAIWHLLHESKVFWRVFEQVQKEKV